MESTYKCGHHTVTHNLALENGKEKLERDEAISRCIELSPHKRTCTHAYFPHGTASDVYNASLEEMFNTFGAR